MTPLGRRACKGNGRSKTDMHAKKMQANSGEPDTLKLKGKKILPYYDINQYHNWWEDNAFRGPGKLEMNLKNEINQGIEEFEIQRQEDLEDLEDYNKLKMENLNEI